MKKTYLPEITGDCLAGRAWQNTRQWSWKCEWTW